MSVCDAVVGRRLWVRGQLTAEARPGPLVRGGDTQRRKRPCQALARQLLDTLLILERGATPRHATALSRVLMRAPFLSDYCWKPFRYSRGSRYRNTSQLELAAALTSCMAGNDRVMAIVRPNNSSTSRLKTKTKMLKDLKKKVWG